MVNAKETPKLKYETPRLERYGSLSELTQTNFGIYLAGSSHSGDPPGPPWWVPGPPP